MEVLRSSEVKDRVDLWCKESELVEFKIMLQKEGY